MVTGIQRQSGSSFAVFPVNLWSFVFSIKDV
jgi:hypothetical protein